MELQGLHHITMITGDAQRNVDFYADTLGLRLVKKTVNFDSPGRLPPVLRRRGRHARHDPHLVRVRGRAPRPRGRGDDPHDPARRRLRGGAELLVQAAGRPTRATSPTRTGWRCELVVSDAEPKRAVHPEIPEEFAITGIVGARAYGQSGPHPLLTDTLGFTARGRGLRARRLHLGLRRAAGRARPARRRHRAPHRLGLARRGPPGVAAARRRGRRARQRRPRPRLLPVDLLRRAARDPVRDRDALAGLRGRRGARAPGRGAAPAASSTSTCARSWRSC